MLGHVNAVAVGVVVLLSACGDAAAAKSAPSPAAARPVARVPTLVDLGAGKCIPCKAMAPILDQLRADYAGRMNVRFIDVWEQPQQAQAHGIRMIPTQIFYAADGGELARHEGFIGREEILSKWRELGISL